MGILQLELQEKCWESSQNFATLDISLSSITIAVLTISPLSPADPMSPPAPEIPWELDHIEFKMVDNTASHWNIAKGLCLVSQTMPNKHPMGNES